MVKQAKLPGLELVGRDLQAVEDKLVEAARSEVRLVMRVSGHILGSGGKRFRPLLMLLTAKMLGLRRRKDIVAYAAAVEFAHTSTLLHDDVIDEADLRRGDLSANRAFGNSAAIIVGDYLLFKAFNLMLAADNPEIVSLVSRVAIEMAEGEAYQLTQKQRLDLSPAQYERIIRSKTALLIQAACEIPAMAAGAKPRQRRALAAFGYRLGLAFQMADDALDYAATGQAWGKKVGKDFLEGKATLPLILAYGRASAAEKEFMRSLFRRSARNEADFQALLPIIARTRALELARERARAEIEAAKRELALFAPGPARTALLELADYVVARDR
jgi:octaprenyl-diphosphate synthase